MADTLEGTAAPMATADQRAAAIEAAFDYRGDVTLRLRDGAAVVGYLFRRELAGPAPHVAVLPAAGGPAATVPLFDIAAIEFTGKDPAAGRTWDAWQRQVAQAKAEGRFAELYPEEL